MNIRLLKFSLIITFITSSFTSNSQNLPSLLTERNINATFSIIAYDETTQEWGIAVATDNIYVGNSTVYIEPGLGAFSVIAETNPEYAIEGFKKLQEGKSIKEAITEVRSKDKNANLRQVSGIDANGNVYAFTGESLKYWKGNSSTLIGEKYVVMGNQLEVDVLTAMSKAFIDAKGTLAQRLLASIQAGQDAGGQVSGKQSVAIVVKGLNNAWYNQIDLRVDHSKTPFKDLKVLMDFHYGRIILNQSLSAIRRGNETLGKEKLIKAEKMLQGWTGIYSRIAQAHLMLQDEDKAIDWIKQGIAENDNWTVNLPAFYVLKDHPKMSSLIKESNFSTTDWEHALGMLSNLGRELELIELAHKLIDRNIESTYLYYLLGRGYYFEKEVKRAIEYLKKAVELDSENVEAQRLLAKLQ